MTNPTCKPKMTETRIVPPDDDNLAEAARLLQQGQVVAFATETVYGLGANARDDGACRAIYQAKDRPDFNPLIVHFSTLQQVAREVFFPPLAQKLAAAFWPGPLTLVLPVKPDCRLSKICRPGVETQAVRIPAHPLALALLKASGLPLAAPSANRSGTLSPTKATHVLDSLRGRIPLILDGGACAEGLESTVLDLSNAPVILRAGAITRRAIEDVLGRPIRTAPSLLEERADHPTLRSPGLLKKHYAPRTPLRLEARDVAPDEALLAFGPTPPDGGVTTLNLSPAGDLQEAAHRLFDSLHSLDKTKNIRAIAVMPIPKKGLGLAINDRLRRAALTTDLPT